MNTIRRLLATMALAVGTAAAAPVDFLAGASVQTDAGFTKSFAQQLTASQSGSYIPNSTITETAASSASLIDGSLHVASTNIANGSDQGLVSMATAFLGDSLTHSAGLNPFSWSGGTQATFNIQIDGSTSMSPGPGDVFNFGYIALVIYQPGTLSDVVPFCDSTVTHAYFWSIGSQPQGADPCGNAFLGNLDGSVDQLLSVSLAPGGDFDFAFGMRVGGAFNANLAAPANASWINDFANTATLRYVAPEGASVASASGAFPGTTAGQVPEPGTLALVGAAALGFARRRRPD